jgi:hypothetical protein
LARSLVIAARRSIDYSPAILACLPGVGPGSGVNRTLVERSNSFTIPRGSGRFAPGLACCKTKTGNGRGEVGPH